MSRLFIVKQYLKYLWNAKNRHGVHSPFVYTFNDEVIADNRNFYAYDAIADLRKKLNSNNQKITVEDFGAGSHHTNNNIRTIKSISKNAGRTEHFGKLLFKMINFYGCKNILELGTSLGIGTAYLAMANTNANITTIEGSKAIAQQASTNINSLNLQNIKQVVGKFDDVLPQIINKNNPFDFVFIDGNHQYEPTLKYFELLINAVSDNCILVFDDIHWSNGMQKAWEAIVADKRVMLSVDVFQFGIVFKNINFKEKQHFVIKY